MCRSLLEHHDGRMTSAEAVAATSGARVAGSPEWPPDTPQALGQPGRARVAVAALVWLLAGASMSSLNKWIFTVHGFGRPLLLSALHMLAAALVCRWGAQRPMPRRTRRQVLLLSLTFGTSMACGNVGLSSVPLDLAQLATTTTPLITLALSALLLGRRHHPLQFAAMGPLCLGAACSLAGELRTPPAGCGFLLAATCLRGLKSIQQSECLGHRLRRCPVTGGEAGCGDPAVCHLGAQLLPAGGCGPGVGGRCGPATCSHQLPPLGLRPAQLCAVCALQLGQLLPAGSHLRPHRPRPGQPHCRGQSHPVPTPVWQPPQRPQLRGHCTHPFRNVPLPQLRVRGLLGYPPGLLAEGPDWQRSLRPRDQLGSLGQPQPESNLGQWPWEKQRAGSHWGLGREVVGDPFGRTILEAGMGFPERNHLLSLACLSSRTSLTTGWWVQTWHSHCA
ncbi:solute carrier family 35 member E4 isoform X1 [Mustela nigripes]|uniref:Solute carrier family 35 member E4 isoform X1 n=1 Tax=Mustela putorius furo TaxID=9669 RepID=A0A8U0TGQ8_MUSPF|nr:solute carrier family 35 member E4 isoform X1 [Mustela putorius furo]XP_059264813.1 solute carrier family 35 member E4 isoform X1 [Mustela nigripes]